MKPIKVAVLGAGNIAATLAETMKQMDQVCLWAVASRNLEKAEAFAKKHDFARAYGSYEEMVQDEEVELVYIATPHSEHCANTLLCLRHDKHVLCEKAFSVNEAEAQSMISLAREKGLLLAEAMWVRYMPMADTLRKVLASGVIGKPMTLTGNLCYLIEHVERMQQPSLAGGALLDLGVYTLNFASIAFGNDIANIDTAVIKTETGVDAQNSVTLTYKDGRMSILNSSLRVLSDRKGIIYGTEGFVIVENLNNFERIEVYNRRSQLVESHDQPKQISGYEYQVAACVDAIQKGLSECPQMPHKETLEIMRQMDQIRAKWGLVYPMEA